MRIGTGAAMVGVLLLSACAAAGPTSAGRSSGESSSSPAAGGPGAPSASGSTGRSPVRVETPSPTTTVDPLHASLPLAVPAGVGTVRRDVAYGPGPAQRLDVHLPPGATRAPVVVFVHGGGWFLGSKSLIDGAGYLPQAPVTRDLLLRRGFAVVSVDYRLSGAARYPAQLDDVKAAIALLRARAAALGIDGGRIALLGESAGAHLALLAGEQVPGIRAVVGYYGITDLRTLDADRAAQGCSFRPSTQAETLLLGVDPSTPAGAAAGAEASPIAHVRAGLPPTLLVHGTEDCTAPTDQSRRMVTALRKAGNEASLLTLDAGHADAVFWTSPVVHERLLAVLDAHLRP